MNKLRIMIRIRLFEEQVSELKLNGTITGPVHTCIGQEAVSTGVCAALSDSDIIIGNHRSHGHLIAKGTDVKSLISQILEGNGRSMHVYDPSVGAICSTAIVGSGLPLGCGVAYASKFKKEDRVTCVFLGDGAVNEGVFYESINLASRWKLPILFVIENNGVSVTTVNEGDFVYRCLPFDIFTQRVDGQNVEEVYHATERAITKLPALIEAKTMRFKEHQEGAAYEKMKDTGYRDNSHVEHWKDNMDPIQLYEAFLLRENRITLTEIDDIYKQEQELINEL